MDDLRASVRAVIYDASGYAIDRMSDDEEAEMIDHATDRIMSLIARAEANNEKERGT